MQPPVEYIEQGALKGTAPHGAGAKKLSGGLKFVFTLLFFGLVLAAAAYLISTFRTQPAVGDIMALVPYEPTDEMLLYFAAGAIILPLLALLLWRFQARHRAVYRSESGCPRCHDHNFIRVRRSRLERMASALAMLPTEREACRTCGWQGLLVTGKDEERYEGSSLPTNQGEVTRQQPNSAGASTKSTTAQQKTGNNGGEQTGKASTNTAANGQSEHAANGQPVHDGGAAPEPGQTSQDAPQEHESDFSPAQAAEDEKPPPRQKSQSRSVYGNAAKLDPNQPQAVVVSPLGLKVRRYPRPDAEVLAVLPIDTVVELLDEGSGSEITTWRQVYTGESTGWVACAFIKRLPRKGSSQV